MQVCVAERAPQRWPTADGRDQPIGLPDRRFDAEPIEQRRCYEFADLLDVWPLSGVVGEGVCVP